MSTPDARTDAEVVRKALSDLADEATKHVLARYPTGGGVLLAEAMKRINDAYIGGLAARSRLTAHVELYDSKDEDA